MNFTHAARAASALARIAPAVLLVGASASCTDVAAGRDGGLDTMPIDARGSDGAPSNTNIADAAEVDATMQTDSGVVDSAPPVDSGVRVITCPASVPVPSRVYYGNTTTTMINGLLPLGEMIAGDPNSVGYFKIGVSCETGRTMQVVQINVASTFRLRSLGQINYGEGSAYPRESRVLALSRHPCDIEIDTTRPRSDPRRYRSISGGLFSSPSNSGAIYFTANGDRGTIPSGGTPNIDLAAGTWYLTVLVEQPSEPTRCQSLFEFLL